MTAGSDDHEHGNDTEREDPTTETPTETAADDDPANEAATDGELTREWESDAEAARDGPRGEPEADQADDDEWRFSVSELDDEDDSEGNVAGSLMRDEPLEPGDIDPENAFFFLVGSLGTIVFIVMALQGL